MRATASSAMYEAENEMDCLSRAQIDRLCELRAHPWFTITASGTAGCLSEDDKKRLAPTGLLEEGGCAFVYSFYSYIYNAAISHISEVDAHHTLCFTHTYISPRPDRCNKSHPYAPFNLLLTPTVSATPSHSQMMTRM